MGTIAPAGTSAPRVYKVLHRQGLMLLQVLHLQQQQQPVRADLTRAGCVDVCVHTAATNGHWECCDDPFASSFQQPSCATGCLFAEYTAGRAECDEMCEKAHGQSTGCTFKIPNGPEKAIAMCGTCNCGLRDCPWAHPEPESCKDPAGDGPKDGDCSWPQRCRGSVSARCASVSPYSPAWASGARRSALLHIGAYTKVGCSYYCSLTTFLFAGL